MTPHEKSVSERMNYCIGTGWWCDESGTQDRAARKTLGDDAIRSSAFFQTWLESITSTASPSTVIVIDSAAPTKPTIPPGLPLQWLALPENAGHSTNHRGRWAGWTRSVMLGCEYAITAESDYFVYVEQDCILSGEGIIEHCISKMKRGVMVGDGTGTPQPLQQSFFIISRSALPGFLHNLTRIKRRDGDLSPEYKFAFASSSVLTTLCNMGILRPRTLRKLAAFLATRFLMDKLPVGSGRARPIPSTQAHFYFQHASRAELAQHGPPSGKLLGAPRDPQTA